MHCGKLWPHHPRTLPPQPRPYGHELCAGFDGPTTTPKSIPQSTCSARLGRSSAAGTVGCPSTALARQHPPKKREQREQEQTDGGLPPIARALAWHNGE